MYNYAVEKFIKQIMILSLIFVGLCGLYFVYLNKLENERNERNAIVDIFIKKKAYEDKEKINSFVAEFDKIKDYNSSYLPPMLSANYLFELKALDDSLKILNNISKPNSDLLNDIIFSLKSKIFANKRMCNQSLQFFQKINSYNSVMLDTKLYLKKCLKEKKA